MSSYFITIPVDVALALGFSKSDVGLNLTEELNADEVFDAVEGVLDTELFAGEYNESTDDL